MNSNIHISRRFYGMPGSGSAHQDLIYDVGMNNGDDTAFYLWQGFRVIAIEADPQLAAAARVRFDEAVSTGQLTILNVGIAEKTGKAKFWINDDHSTLSSFHEDFASRFDSRYHSIEVETIRFRDIIREFGVPYYLKVDIEGADYLCVKDLEPSSLPKFISLETECWTEGHILSDDEGMLNLRYLKEAGYRRFKLIDQADFSSPAIGSRYWVNRAIRSAAYGRLALPGLSHVARHLTPANRLGRLNYQFPFGSSGPCGDAASGSWMSGETAERLYRSARRKIPDKWYDWHATS